MVSYRFITTQHSAGAIAQMDNSKLIVHGNSTVTFNDNKARSGGRARSFTTCNSTFKGLTFNSYTALSGGAAYYDNCSIVSWRIL